MSWDQSLGGPATRLDGNSISNASVHSVGGAHASPNPSGHLDAMVSRRKGKEREEGQMRGAKLIEFSQIQLLDWMEGNVPFLAQPDVKLVLRLPS